MVFPNGPNSQARPGHASKGKRTPNRPHNVLSSELNAVRKASMLRNNVQQHVCCSNNPMANSVLRRNVVRLIHPEDASAEQLFVAWTLDRNRKDAMMRDRQKEPAPRGSAKHYSSAEEGRIMAVRERPGVLWRRLRMIHGRWSLSRRDVAPTWPARIDEAGGGRELWSMSGVA